VDPGGVTLLWLVGSALMVYGGYWLQATYGYVNNVAPQHPDWEFWNGIPLFTGIALLALSLLDTKYRNRIAMAGWVLFGAYWALTARDLFTREGSDYVNMIGAMVAVFGINYLAYHEWLNIKRGVQNTATRYLAVVASVAAGFYFLIAKVAVFRVGLIQVVGDHTRSMLDLFGMGDKLGLEFVINEHDTLGPVSFRYPDTHLTCPDGTPQTANVGEAYCLDHSGAEGWFQELLMWLPASERLPGEHGLLIVWVSIILACTAIQTIALFAGLFLGTDAPWRKRLVWVGAVGAVIYVLNLMRNTLVIWAYGRGHMSFFMVHNVLAKVLTLAALIGIVMVAFKRFPAFFLSLGHVLDLPHRDGPIEHTLKLGRKRPEHLRISPPGPPAP
jgi:exosortase/archaeosortase family protein